MTTPEIRDLDLEAKNDDCACGDHAGHETAEPVATIAESSVLTDYLVEGMTCSHCVRSVTEEITAIPGVADVAVDLNAGGASRVRVASDAPLDDAKVREAVEEAGYSLALMP